MTISRTIKVLLAAVGLVMLAAIEGASAKVVKWQLENVKFDDGDPVTGFFLFDADASPDKRLVGLDILLTPFDPLPAYRLNSLELGDTWLPETDIDCGNPGAGGCILLFSKILYDIDPIGRTSIELDLWPDTALSDGGGKAALSGFETDTYFFGLVVVLGRSSLANS